MTGSKRLHTFAKGVKSVAKVLAILLASYGLFLIAGFIPVNNDFCPTQNGIEIQLSSDAIHADIIVPISTPVIDWRKEFAPETFKESTGNATHVCFGWGDKGFYLDTPTWSDLKVSTAVNAMLLPSESCLHIAFKQVQRYSINTKSVRISEAQYAKLVSFIKKAFKTDAAGKNIQIPGRAYRKDDAFFEAHGSYHALYTCNSWVGQALKISGVRVPWFTPLPKTPMLYLPNATD